MTFETPTQPDAAPQDGIPPELEGQRMLGRYELLYRVGAGGMAAVFLARDRGVAGLDRWVAIKRIHPQLSQQERFTAMVLDEARLVARIAHPNVAQVLDLGAADGVPYIVMEYLHGQTLSAVIRRAVRERALDVDAMARILADAAEGVHAAHELRGADGSPLGLVHRDLSPQNVFVTYAGAVKVVDFGIAKARGRLTLTEPGILKGKFSYMSPEQARGGGIDRRSDVFALGLVLYEATTGRRLLEGSDQSVLSLLSSGESAVPRFDRRTPAELAAIVTRALAPDPDARFATAREMARALEKLVVGRRALTDPAQIAAWMERLFPQQSRTPIGTFAARPRPDTDPPPPTKTTVADTGSPRRRRVAAIAAAGLLVLVGLVALASLSWQRNAGDRGAATAVAPVAAPPQRAPSAPPPGRGPSSSLEVIGEAPLVLDVAPAESRAPREPPPAVGPSRTGLLDVRSVPWSRVTVGGSAPRLTPMVGRRLPAGWHWIRLVTEDGRSKRMRIRITPGQTTTVMARF